MVTNNAINNSVKITQFTSDGTWTKDSRTQYIKILMWCGGGGGSSGSRNVSGGAKGGGGGGGSGFLMYEAPSNFFSSTETVVVGVGGTGGAAQTVDSSIGNAGANGTNSSFGNIVFPMVDVSNPAGGTDDGFGGMTGESVINSLFFSTYYYYPNDPGRGGNGSVTAGIKPDSIGYINEEFGNYFPFCYCVNMSSGGGGGGGADSVTERAGGGGGDITDHSETLIQSGGTGGVESGTINGGTGPNQMTSGGVMTGGCGGGGGGGQSAGAVAGNGGHGGFPGGGGGGGGGSLNGTNSGAGGDGGDGLVIVIEHF